MSEAYCPPHRTVHSANDHNLDEIVPAGVAGARIRQILKTSR